jgi:hypothetical protein
MTHKIVAGLVLVFIAAMGPHALTAQQQDGVGRRNATGPPRTRPVAGASAIVGRVFDSTTNAPVRRAQVEASNGNSRDVWAMTDDEGRFELLDLSAGEWRVTVSKGGYFTWELGQHRPFEAPPRTRLAARQRMTVEIPLTRGGVILGRVYDEAGEPLAGLRVRVYRTRMAQGYRRLEAVGAADETDDTGSYRIYGLAPGDYYVAASLRVAPPDSVVQTTYSPTYYPGTGDLAEAQRIRLELGAEATAGFALLPVRQVRVSGTVLTSSGAPANAFLNLTSESAELGVPLGIGGVTKPDGTFTLPDVPPGRYVLNASLRGDGPSEIANMPITVAGADVTGAALVTGRPASMRGRLVTDAGASRPLPTGLSVIAVASRAGGTVLDSASGTAFELDDLAEPFHLRVDDLPESWTVKAIVVNGLDVTDGTIALPTGQDAEAQVVLTDRVAEVSGTLPAAVRPRSVSVVVFPEDEAKWTYPSRYVRMAEVDARGRFRVLGLPPRERYLALATDYLEDGEHNDPEFLTRMREVAIRFPLDDGEKRTIDLTVTER